MLNNSSFRRSPYSIRRKQIDFPPNPQENYIQSIGDTPFVDELIEQIIVQPPRIIHYNDYIYMIYLLVLTIFYIYYIIIILQDKFDDNYEHEIPRLLWFRKGYRLH
jgi:hypothetical protein